MHIPDGFLATPVWAAMNVVSAPAIGLLARRAERGLHEGNAPLLGVMGAFVFAAQMINFPVWAGTSGHLVGSALLACTLGPAAAVIVMTAILALQALVFQDGGLLALGANVFNMAVAGVLAGYLPYRYWGGGSWRRASVFAGGLLSVLTASSLALAELKLSGVPMPGGVVAASALVFLVSALVEGAITLAVFGGLEKMNANWVQAPAVGDGRIRGMLAAAALLLGSVGVLLASGLPDGLEKLAENLGIGDRAQTLIPTPLGDYELQILTTPWLRRVAAGLAGLALIYLLCLALGRIVARRKVA